jgi:Nucleotidyl transferase AbiEii toxin, Type IV TA system
VSEFLHDRKDFGDLLAVVADERSLDPTLVEKDYWIMHCLWGLRAQGGNFELKGSTSLSKGFGVIHRFSEDIDNRAVDVPCYALTHTFVEKLHTISTKYRKLGEAQAFPANFLRH